MKNLITLLSAGTCAVALFAGCGDNSSKVTSATSKAFDSAPAEVQTAWRTALAASETNGYVLAVTTLRGLAGQQLSVEQVEAVQTAMRAVSAKLTASVQRGDAAAIAAEKEIKAGAVRSR